VSSRRSRAFVALLRKSQRSLWTSDFTVPDIRRRIQRLDKLVGIGRNPARIETTHANGIQCEWVRAAGISGTRVLMYIHGGGFALHCPQMYAKAAAKFSEMFDAAVLVIDYRLAPEYPFPAAPDDCLATYRWLVDNLNVDPGRLLVAGDSAGGNLALVTLLMAKKAGLPMPAAAWAISPSVDCNFDAREIERLSSMQDPMFNEHSLRLLDPYFGDNDRSDYRISPINGELSGLPPIRIEAGGLEFLASHPNRFKRRAEASGVTVEAEVWPGMPHCFQFFGFLPEAREARQKAHAFFERHTQ
jgi:acetyl esterase/lipase